MSKVLLYYCIIAVFAYCLILGIFLNVVFTGLLHSFLLEPEASCFFRVLGYSFIHSKFFIFKFKKPFQLVLMLSLLGATRMDNNVMLPVNNDHDYYGIRTMQVGNISFLVDRSYRKLSNRHMVWYMAHGTWCMVHGTWHMAHDT